MFPFSLRFVPKRRPSRPPWNYRRIRPRVEQLEARYLLAGFPLTPMGDRRLYGFGAATVGVNDGTGETIAIIDAFGDSRIFKDVDTFDKTFRVTSGENLYKEYGPASSFLTVYQMASPLKNNLNWGVEISTDVEWAHAIAPGAKILLVEAAAGNLSSLLAAVDYASSQPGVVAVSMSWGTNEFAKEVKDDSHFPANNGITYVAASGDTGSVPLYPAVSPNVLGVGGTTLHLQSGAYASETGWSNSYGGSGGGVSAYESKPAYQANVPQSSTNRTSPDVAYDANPNTGYNVADSGYYYDVFLGWLQAGGTSVGAPQWAALIAIADQNRIAAGGTALSSADTLNALYGLLGSGNVINTTYLHDITSGGPAATPAAPGYDLSTGLGSPIANELIAYLSNLTLVPSSVIVKAAAVRPSAAAAKSTAAIPVHPAATVAAPGQVGTASSAPLVAVVAAQAPPLPVLTPVVLVPPAAASTPVVVPAAGSGFGSAPAAPAVVLPLPSQQSSNGTVQSGGGDNRLLPAVDQGDDEPDALPPADASTPSTAAPALGTAPGEAPQTAALWPRAHAECFAAGDWAAVTLQNAPASRAARVDGLGAAFDPAAALAGMAVALGGYWGARTDEADPRQRQALRPG